MKKFFLILALSIFTLAGAFAQFTADQMIDGFEGFSEDIAKALPLASNIGLNWNDASMSGFPHFGVGLTVGSVILPSSAFTQISSNMASLTQIEDLDVVSQYGGLPLPVYCIDARLGIPILPIDVGVKYGIIPEAAKEMLPSDFGFNYYMVGADVRWTILDGGLVMPELSVGGGYTRLSGSVSTAMPDQTINDPGIGSDIYINSSDLVLAWTTDVIDLKAQVSKKLLIFNFSAGLGYTFGTSSAGGGFDATISTDSGELTTAEKDQLSNIGLDVTDNGISVLAENNGGTIRAFGGVGVQLAILKLDLGVIYGLDSETLGVSSNIRLQF